MTWYTLDFLCGIYVRCFLLSVPGVIYFMLRKVDPQWYRIHDLSFWVFGYSKLALIGMFALFRIESVASDYRFGRMKK
ncbi:MAG: hypothetical protein QGG73_05720 [Candidatus Hydrogenedentes bacterium]|nr:hypothetical protein [Candidatus Hydrogenedentota bacterium]